MPIQLNEVEARLLGSLIEKSLTTPDQYPLTYHSLILACNQKSSREPLMSLTEESAGPALHSLIQRDLVDRLAVPGGRVPKFRHAVESFLPEADAKTIGAVCVLLLRGPQTPGEIKTRTERLCVFSSTAEVEALLQDLCARPDPFIAKLPRRPGQKESRYRQLFCAGPDAEVSASPAPAAVSAPAEEALTLDGRLEALEARVRALEERFGPPKD